MKELFKRVFYAEKPEHEKTGLRSLEQLKESLYRVSLNYPYATAFIRDDSHAVLIGQNTFISLSSESYVEIASGIFQRVILSPEDIKFDDERRFLKMIEKVDFTNNLVIFCRFVNGGALKPHYHMTEQRIRCLAGSFVGTIEGQIFRAGEEQVIPAKEIHFFQPIQDGYALLLQAKK